VTAAIGRGDVTDARLDVTYSRRARRIVDRLIEMRSKEIDGRTMIRYGEWIA
jgi:hypothetical protein